MTILNKQNIKPVLIAIWLPIFIIVFSVWFASCNETGLVKNIEEFNEPGKNAVPGAKIILANDEPNNRKELTFAAK